MQTTNTDYWILLAALDAIAEIEGIATKPSDRLPNYQPNLLQFAKKELKEKKNYNPKDLTHQLLLITQLEDSSFSTKESKTKEEADLFFDSFLVDDFKPSISVRIKRAVTFSSIGHGTDEITPNIEDDRLEFFKIEEVLKKYFSYQDRKKFKQFKKLKQNLEAVVLVVHKEFLEDYGDQEHQFLKIKTLSNMVFTNNPGVAIRPGGKFGSNYSSSARGSGFFIQKGIIATAKHLSRPEDPASWLPPQEMRYISGFSSDFSFQTALKEKKIGIRTKNGEKELGFLIPNSQIFLPKVSPQEKDFYVYGTNNDWALTKVVPMVASTKFPKPVVYSTEKIKLGRSVYGAGHGLGLAKKIQFDGIVTTIESNSFKVCLDFFGGDSGSPVFDSLSQELIGILYGGEDDFVNLGNNLLIPFRYECLDGRGEDCQKLGPVLEMLNQFA